MTGLSREDIARFEQEQGLPRGGLLDWLSREDELLVANIKMLYELTELLKGAPSGGTTVITAGGGIGAALGIRTESIIKGYQARSTEVVYPSALAKCLGAVRVVVIIRNALNEDVAYNIIGNTNDSYSSAFTIATSSLTTQTGGIYQLAFEEWMPYIGAQITPSVAPTVGGIDVDVLIQEWS